MNIFELIEEDKMEKVRIFKALSQEQLDVEAERMSAKGKAEAAKIAAYNAEHGIDPEATDEDEEDDEEVDNF